MSFPTVLAPWFVVQRLRPGDQLLDYPPIQYYQESDEGMPMWKDDPNSAMIFMSLHSAHRVARATASEVRVLVDKDDLKEFRPKGEL